MIRCPRRLHFGGGPLAVLAVLAMAVGACGSSGAPTRPSASPPAVGTAAPSLSPAAPSTGPDPVIIDTDLSSDDTMALPFLLREPGIDVLAVTVVGTGLVHCGAGIQAVTNILATLGIDGVPVSCGRDEPLAGTHAFPAEWRAAADDGFGLALERRSVSMPALDAPALIRSLAGSAARPITIVALGPMTNLAEAIRDDASLAARIERLVVMGGAIDVPGNVALGAPDDPPLPAEWNVYADPTAADIVFRSGVPITLVPLDATNHVPLNSAFVVALEADHVAAAADIAYELLMKHGVAPGEFFWDQLASVVAVDESVATFETMNLSVETTEGPDSGRISRADDGASIRVATSADAKAFEARFLAGLRLGPPRPNPFVSAGTFAARFDGSTCVDEAPDVLAAGDWIVTVQTRAAGTTAFVVVRFHEGAGWDELLEYFATAEDPTAQPSFVDVAAYSIFEAPGSATLIAPVAPGSYGLVCLHIAADVNLGFAGSGPFTVGP